LGAHHIWSGIVVASHIKVSGKIKQIRFIRAGGITLCCQKF
jgi:hypothetical protein